MEKFVRSLDHDRLAMFNKARFALMTDDWKPQRVFLPIATEQPVVEPQDGEPKTEAVHLATMECQRCEVIVILRDAALNAFGLIESYEPVVPQKNLDEYVRSWDECLEVRDKNMEGFSDKLVRLLGAPQLRFPRGNGYAPETWRTTAHRVLQQIGFAPVNLGKIGHSYGPGRVDPTIYFSADVVAHEDTWKSDLVRRLQVRWFDEKAFKKAVKDRRIQDESTIAAFATFLAFTDV